VDWGGTGRPGGRVMGKKGIKGSEEVQDGPSERAEDEEVEGAGPANAGRGDI
jgi:hypothetical protein